MTGDTKDERKEDSKVSLTLTMSEIPTKKINHYTFTPRLHLHPPLEWPV